MDLQLAGRRALVTGGSRGIGKAIAAALLVEGAVVTICARTADALHRTPDELGPRGVNVTVVHPGLTRTEATPAVVAALAAAGGLAAGEVEAQLARRNFIRRLVEASESLRGGVSRLTAECGDQRRRHRPRRRHSGVIYY